MINISLPSARAIESAMELAELTWLKSDMPLVAEACGVERRKLRRKIAKDMLRVRKNAKQLKGVAKNA